MVPVLGDTFQEGNDTFSVVLGSPVNAAILDGVGVGTIRNDDGGPMFLLSSMETSEDVLSSYESNSTVSNTTANIPSTPIASASTTTPELGSLSRRTASQRRSAVDEALADEEDWSLVA